MKKVIFIPTWKCNLKCAYCDYSTTDKGELYTLKAFDKTIDIGKELTWMEWVEVFSKMPPLLLEMTGGEPTKYKDLPKLLKHMGAGSMWAITSNTLLTEQIEQMPVENCLAWTASYHYHSDDLFLDNIMLLAKKGINVRVTIVISPDNYKVGFEKVKSFISKGIGVNIHPILKQDFDWQADPAHKEIWGAMEQMEQLAPGFVVMIKDISDRWVPEHYPICDAGTDKYSMLMPDGMVYRCYSQILTGTNEGHINDYTPKTMPEGCTMDCMFPCDRQVARKTETKVKLL